MRQAWAPAPHVGVTRRVESVGTTVRALLMVIVPAGHQLLTGQRGGEAGRGWRLA